MLPTMHPLFAQERAGERAGLREAGGLRAVQAYRVRYVL